MHRTGLNSNGLVTSTASATLTKALVLIFIGAVITSRSTVAMDGKKDYRPFVHYVSTCRGEGVRKLVLAFIS